MESRIKFDCLMESRREPARFLFINTWVDCRGIELLTDWAVTNPLVVASKVEFWVSICEFLL